MLARLVRRFFWMPFEAACRVLPLWPFRVRVSEVADGVLLLRPENLLVRGLGALAGGYDYACSYLVDGTVLVDTGFPWARRSLAQTFLRLGLPRTLRYAFNTHYHEDHVGNNDLVTTLTDATLLAHQDALGAIRFPPELRWYRRFLFGPASPSAVQRAPAFVDTPRFRLEVLDLPGHCPGHLGLFEPTQRWLFSGDLYVAAELDTQLDDVDGPAWIRSLDFALSLRPAALFDAHGTVIRGEGEVRAALSKKRTILAAIGRETQRAAVRGPQSIEAITRAVFTGGGAVEALSLHEGWMSLLTGSDFSRSHLVASFVRALPAATDPADGE